MATPVDIATANYMSTEHEAAHNPILLFPVKGLNIKSLLLSASFLYGLRGADLFDLMVKEM